MDDSKRKVGRQAPWKDSVDPEPGEFGQWLRREREVREVTLEEISEVTKISKTYLRALEEERFDILPAPVFAKGFLREYAKYVGLDPDEVVNSYLTALSDEEPESSVETNSTESSFDWTHGALLAVGLIVLVGVIGFLGFRAERSQRGEPASGDSGAPTSAAPAEPMAAEAAAPGAGRPAPPVDETPPPPRAPAPEAPLVVTIDFVEDCWVEATVDGRRRLSELHVQGESLQIEAERRVELTLGNPAGVVVEVNGAPYALPEFRPGRVARDIVIDVEAEG